MGRWSHLAQRLKQVWGVLEPGLEERWESTGPALHGPPLHHIPVPGPAPQPEPRRQRPSGGMSPDKERQAKVFPKFVS